MPTFFRKYLLPGFVFQSIVIGGGYGTGREIVEFFLRHGPLGGYLGMVVAASIWSLILAISFELARRGGNYDYRTFVGALLGRGWILFELLYIASLIVTVAVLGSASGELLSTATGLPQIVGIGLMMAVVGFLTFRGSLLIERVFAFWSLALYAFYVILIFLVIGRMGDQIVASLGVADRDPEWILGAIKYAAYNLAAIPAMLFSLRHLESRKEAFLSGLIAGPICMFPAVLVFTTMLAQYPEVLSSALPVNTLLNALELPTFQLAFQLILFGTFIETGTGMIHGFNERIASVYAEGGREMPDYLRLSLAVSILLIAIYFASRFGLINLIAKGYGYVTWGYWLLLLLPVLTIGVWQIARSRNP